MSKRSLAKAGKQNIEKVLFSLRKSLTEKHLDPSRDSVLMSWATYSPWLLDQDFQDCHAKIRDYTLVDLYRCWELWHLLGQTQHIGGDVIEVGTWRGGTGCLLGQRARMLGLPVSVFLCDTFEGVVKTGTADIYQGGEHSDTSLAIVSECAASLKLDNLRILCGIFPDKTAAEIADRAFRFCHIDVDVYQSGKDVLEWVWPRLAVGGVVVFDDFGFSSTRGIAKLVHEEENAGDRVSIQNLNGHAVFVKTRQ
ncbi:MAG: class I SAM-dependent methyltransferase [bacterium]|nr:class I SAM-dependent methyltransferase [bacterium]